MGNTVKVYNGFNDRRIKRKPRCVAIGVFDGVHRGHQKILSRVLTDAKHYHAEPLVVTFEPHPNKILRPGTTQPILMSLPHRLRFFEKMGIRETLVIRFNKNFSKMTREQFLHKFLFKKLGMRSLSVGTDFRFGFRGLGEAVFLKQESSRLNFGLTLVQPLKHQGEIISSTRIRRLIERGFLRKAKEMLGRPVSVYGTVVRGRGRGRAVGFPTANLNPHHETLPPSGVYAAWGFLEDRRLKGVIHIGKRPTFHDKEKSLEVHFFNFHRNIYGRELELLFAGRLRATRKFKSIVALTEAIQKDARKALKILSAFAEKTDI